MGGPARDLGGEVAAVKKLHELPGKIHELKTDPEPFAELWYLLKTFEYRINDRDYQIGDTLELREHDVLVMGEDPYSGREVHAIVSSILHVGDHVIMSLDVLARVRVKRNQPTDS